MAATLAGSRLTELHRATQMRIGIQTAARVASTWPLLDLTAPGPWVDAALATVEAQAAQAARIAGAYAATYRAAELGEADPDFQPEPMAALNLDQIRTSLLITGPINAKKLLGAGRLMREAMEAGRMASAQAGMRHALNAGRQVIVDTANADPQARGWARVASGKACAFCAMLASRGPDYGSEGSASFRAHDRCGCSVEPHYRGDGMSPQGRRFREMWDATTRGVPSGQQLAAFRAALANPA